MKLRYFLSASRFSTNRDSIKQVVEEFCSFRNIELPQGAEAARYDCNEDDSTLRPEPKQQGYLQAIRFDTDLFIAVLDSDTIGYYTMLEIKEAYTSYLETGYPVCLILDDNQPQKHHASTNSVTRDQLHEELMALADEHAQATTIGSAEASPNRPTHFFADYNHPLSPEMDLRRTLEKSLRDIFENHRLGLRQFAQHGEFVHSEAVMHRRGRVEHGYTPNLYFTRKIDEELAQSSAQFILIKGLPGAGKSRALLRHIHENLGDKLVIVINNLATFNDLFTMLFENSIYGYRLRPTIRIREHYYLIFDELNHLLAHAATNTEFGERWRTFCEVIDNNGLFQVLSTTTEEGYLQIKSRLSDVVNQKVITVQPLDQNNEDDARILRYFNHPGSQSSLSIGYLIPRSYSLEQQVDAILQHPYKRYLFLGYRVAKRYSRNSFNHLCYSVMVMNTMLENQGEQLKAGELLSTLKELSTQGVIRLYNDDVECDELPTTAFNLRRRHTIENYEWRTLIAPSFLIFFDDMLWQLIEQRLIQSGELQDEREIIDLMIDTFTVPETYNKALTRAQDKPLAWNYMHRHYAKQMLGDHSWSREERYSFLAVLMIYAPTLEDAVTLAEQYKEEFPICSQLVAALYARASHAKFHNEPIEPILDVIARYEPHITEHNIFYVSKRVELCNTFDEASQLIQSYLPDLYHYEAEENSLTHFNRVVLFDRWSQLVNQELDLRRICDNCRQWNLAQGSDGKARITLPPKALRGYLNGLDDEQNWLDIHELLMNLLGPKSSTERYDQLLFTGEQEWRYYCTLFTGLILKRTSNYKEAHALIKELTTEAMQPQFLTTLISKRSMNDKENSFDKVWNDHLSLCRKHNIPIGLIQANALLRKTTEIAQALRIVQAMPIVDNWTLNNILEKIAYVHTKRSVKNYTDSRRMQLEQVRKQTKQIIPAINERGIICNTAETTSRFSGVHLSMHSLVFLYNIFKNDHTWVDQLIAQSPQLQAEALKNEHIYAVRIKTLSSFDEALRIFEQYEQQLILPQLNELQSGARRLHPNCFRSLCYVLARCRREARDAGRAQLRPILERYRPYMAFDSTVVAEYFAAHDHLVFATLTQEETDWQLSDLYNEALEKVTINEYFGSTLLADNFDRFTFWQALYLYEDLICRHMEDPTRYPMPHQQILGFLAAAVRSKEDLNDLEDLIQEYQIDVTAESVRKMRNHIQCYGLNLSRDYTVTLNTIDQVNDRIRRAKDIGQVIRILEGQAVDRVIDQQFFHYALGKIKQLGSSAKARHEATRALNNLRSRYRITHDLKTYNKMLWIYYPEVEKRALLEEMAQCGVAYDSFSCVSVIADWGCNKELRRAFYERLKLLCNGLLSTSSLYAMLKREGTELITSFDPQAAEHDAAPIFEVLDELNRRRKPIHQEVWEKWGKDFNNSSWREFYQQAGDVAGLFYDLIGNCCRNDADHEVLSATKLLHSTTRNE